VQHEGIPKQRDVFGPSRCALSLPLNCTLSLYLHNDRYLLKPCDGLKVTIDPKVY